MLEVFQNHEKRTSEEAGTSERTHHLPYRSPSLLPLSSTRMAPGLPVLPSNSKMPLGLHHPSLPLPSNVMVVPPQQIATSTSHQSFINNAQKRKVFPLAVAHPIIRQNPNFNPALAHGVPTAIPQKLKPDHPSGSSKIGQESPLDLSAPLDLSLKRKKDAETAEHYPQSAIKRPRISNVNEVRGERSASPSQKCSSILSKPPPIYPGLHRTSAEHFIRQQRKVHPLVHDSSQSDSSLLHQKYFPQQPKMVRNKETNETKLMLARQEFALKSPKILQKSLPPSHQHMPVKRVQVAVPPLVTSSSGSSRLLPHRDQVPALINPHISEHNRIINEEKKHQLLARAAAMGIPVDQEPICTQQSPRSSQPFPRTSQPPPRTSQLIKENGAVDSEMEEALRQMMQRSPSHRPSSSSSPNGKPKPPVSPTQNSEMRRKLFQKAACLDFMKKHMMMRNYPQRPNNLLERTIPSRPSSAHSPPMPAASRPTSFQEKQEILKRRYLYEVQNGIPPSSVNGLSQPIRSSPPSLRDCDRKMKLVQGVGTNSGPQYKYTLKDFDHRQHTAPSVTQERSKTGSVDPRGHLLQRGHDSKDGRIRMYQELHKRSGETCRQDQVVPTQNGAGSQSPGCTASRGPASQGLPHPISRLTPNSPSTPTMATLFQSQKHLSHFDSKHQSPQEKHGAVQSPFRPRKNLINPEVARDHILASMNPALRDLFQEKDQEKQLQLFQSLRKKHSSQFQKYKGFAINFRDVIAHEISKCIDESSDTSEVIDLTSEPSDSTGEVSSGDVSGRVGSPQTNPPAAPVSIENLKQVIDMDNPPPLIKSTDAAKTGFVPLNSNSVIVSGAVAYSRSPSLSERPRSTHIPQVIVDAKTVEPIAACDADTKVTLTGIKMDFPDKVSVKEEAVNEDHDIECNRSIKQEVILKMEESASMNDIACVGQSSNTQFTCKMNEAMMTAEPSLGTPGCVKSVSYDPRRKVLAALNEQSKFTPPISEDAVPGSEVKATAIIEPALEKYSDTKIIPRADQVDKECQLPDQLLEDDEDDDKVEEVKKEEVKELKAEDEIPPEVEPKITEDGPPTKEEVQEGNDDEDEEDDATPETQADEEASKPRRKRKRRVRRYYHIVPRRTSSRKGTIRKPPQFRRMPAPVVKPKFEDFSPEVLQVRTRNSDGRRRQAAMASSYHRDDRYEQEIEKEQQKVMERRRRRTAVLRNQGLRSEISQDFKSAKTVEKSEVAEETRESPRRRRCKASSAPPLPIAELTKRTTDRDEGILVEDGGLETNEDYERRLMSPNMELKVRIQRKDLTGKFHENDSWQIVSEEKPKEKERRKLWPLPSLMKRKRLEARSEWPCTSQPSTSGLFALQLNGKLKRRRRGTEVRRRLLEARVIPDSRPSVPPPPKELKRLAVNKKLGETLLHKAARLGHDESALYCINYCTQDINAKDNAGYTPLHECCVNGRLKVAKHMIAKGADVNGSAADGTRPVHDAIDNEKVELGRLLLAHGGDPLIATYSGRTTRKLARSKETKTLIHGYLKDINGRFLAPVEELDALKKINLNIRFHSSVQTNDDVVKSGIDFMAGAPGATPDGDTDDALAVFELSDEPMLPSFALYLEEPKKFSNWLLLSDVLQRLRMTRTDFMCSHRDVTVYTTSRQEVQDSTSGPNNLTANLLERNPGKRVELVELDDHIRWVLGSDVERVK